MRLEETLTEEDAEALRVIKTVLEREPAPLMKRIMCWLFGHIYADYLSEKGIYTMCTRCKKILGGTPPERMNDES
jgi:hypothetical protein